MVLGDRAKYGKSTWFLVETKQLFIIKKQDIEVGGLELEQCR